MYSMQRLKQTSVDQVKISYGISIVTNKNKLLEGLKLNIFEKCQCNSPKQGYRMLQSVK